MKDKYVLTAESVTEGHPDKLCDTIADAVVDACLEHDPTAHVACEVMATAGKIIVAGEITAARFPDIPAVICRTVREAGYGGSDYEVEVITHEQSPDIAGAVNNGAETGAGDQGIVYGYACDETPEFLPLPVVLAHKLTRLLTQARKLRTIPSLKPDGKAQVSVEYQFGVPKRVSAVVVSCQHEDGVELAELRHAVMRHIIQPAFQDFPLDAETEILINPSGRFVEGGFEADTGLTGRKLMVDTYGGLAPHGGGALSGKDGTKVDRSGAYCEVMFDKRTSGEVPEHRAFIYETAIPRLEQLGVPVRVLRSDKTYLDLFAGTVTRGPKKGLRRGFPLCGHCYVQRDCKLRPIRRYNRTLTPDTVQYVGIAYDEQKRLSRLKNQQVSLLAKYKFTEEDAKQLCQTAGLLSPVYAFTDRGGCWFCPNAKRKELRHLYDNHPELWAKMLELQAMPGKVSEKFNRTEHFSDIDAAFRKEDALCQKAA